MSGFTQQQVIDYLLGEGGTFSERKSFRMAIKLIDKLIDEQQAEANALKSENNQLKSELNSVNEYKDKLTAAVSVLVGQCKSGEVSLGAIYDVDILLGE